MRPVLRVRDRVFLGAGAFAALVAAHALTFLIAAPEHHARAELLHETGHGSWTNAFVLAGAAALGTLIALGGRWASAEPEAGRGLLRFTWIRLAALQTLGFVLLESVERVLSGSGPLDALGEPLVGLGVVVQLAAAFLFAFVLLAFTRLVRRLLEKASLPVSDVEGIPSPPTFILFRSVSTLAWNLRGPPTLIRLR